MSETKQNFVKLDAENFDFFATQQYINSQCTSIAEFKHDLDKIKFIKRHLSRFECNNEININLFVNHFVIFFNVFSASGATRMLFFKIEQKYWSVLKPVLLFLDHLPLIISNINGQDINTNTIPLNNIIVNKLREIKTFTF